MSHFSQRPVELGLVLDHQQCWGANSVLSGPELVSLWTLDTQREWGAPQAARTAWRRWQPHHGSSGRRTPSGLLCPPPHSAAKESRCKEEGVLSYLHSSPLPPVLAWEWVKLEIRTRFKLKKKLEYIWRTKIKHLINWSDLQKWTQTGIIKETWKPAGMQTLLEHSWERILEN